MIIMKKKIFFISEENEQNKKNQTSKYSNETFKVK